MTLLTLPRALPSNQLPDVSQNVLHLTLHYTRLKSFLVHHFSSNLPIFHLSLFFMVLLIPVKLSMRSVP